MDQNKWKILNTKVKKLNADMNIMLHIDMNSLCFKIKRKEALCNIKELEFQNK